MPNKIPKLEMINATMIVLARESRGMNQSELADKISMSSTNLSKIERGDIGVGKETIELIAQATHFPLSFFEQTGGIVPENMNYRKRQTVAQRLLTPINAKVNIIRLHIQQITRELKIPTPIIPSLEITESQTPAIVAIQLRKLWKIETPIIENVTELLENKGIAINNFNFGTERVDSRCVLTDDKYPIIFSNDSLLGDRQRFSLVFQLGHLIMHTFNTVDWNRDISHEANLFAAEFLMPEKDIRKDFEEGITVSLLGELKRKWKVSMISLLYRADDLGFITENQKKYIIQQFNELKIRRREPVELDISIEKPAIIRSWLRDIKSNQKIDTKEIASFLHLSTDEFIELYN